MDLSIPMFIKQKENQTVAAPPGDRMEMIKRQLGWGTGSFLLEGPLLKRSDFLVLKAHKEAANSLNGNGSPELGTIATVVAAANWTVLKCSIEIEAEMRESMRREFGLIRHINGPMDNLMILKENLRVKNEELQLVSRELCAFDSAASDIVDKLFETDEDAEAAASVALIEYERRNYVVQFDHTMREATKLKITKFKEMIFAVSIERDRYKKERDDAIGSTYLLRSDHAKAADHAAILEAVIVRAEAKTRVAEADAQSRIKEASKKESVALQEKQELLSRLNMLQTQIQRQQIDIQHG